MSLWYLHFYAANQIKLVRDDLHSLKKHLQAYCLRTC